MYHIFQAYIIYILKVSLLFSVPVLVTCTVLEEKAVGEEDAGKQRKNDRGKIIGSLGSSWGKFKVVWTV